VRAQKILILVDGETAAAVIGYGCEGLAVAVDGAEPALDARVVEAADGVHVLRNGRQTIVRCADLAAYDFSHADQDGLISAPMHGKVLALYVKAGDMVAKGQRLAVIEAMKMEHTLTAPWAGKVSDIAADTGSQVAEGMRLMTITATDKG